MTITNEEKACKDMADVCELAHKRTVADCERLGIAVDCESVEDCGDEGQLHKGDEDFDEEDTHYTAKAQEIFDGHYEHICSVTGI